MRGTINQSGTSRGVWLALLAGTFILGVAGGWFLPRSASQSAETPVPNKPSPGIGRGDTFTVATYNLHNFFDGFDNPYTDDEATPQKSKTELDNLAAAIRQLDADVLVLQEVETGGFLKRFVQTRLADAGYQYIVDESTEDPRGITIAALSRLPIVRIVSRRLVTLRDDPAIPPTAINNRFARDLLRLDVAIRPGRVIALFGLHFKSRLDAPDDPGSAKWRLAEAHKARAIIREEMAIGANPAARFIVLGDANDLPDSPPLQALLTTTAPPLVDALAGIAGDARITFENQQYKEAIDHVLLSPELAGALIGAEVLRGSPFDRASDHRPVRIALRLP